MTPSLPRRLILSVLLGAACPACLILDPVDFPPRENHRPYVEETDPPQNAWVILDRESIGSLVFEMTVVDEDTEDELDARAFVDFDPGDRAVVFGEVVGREGDDTRRIVTARFRPGGDFTPGCHLVEIDVVDDRSGWEPTGTRVLKEGVARDTAYWWVFAHDGDDLAEVPPVTCRVGDDGAPEDGVAR